MRAVRYHYTAHPLLHLLHAIPNGGKRNKITAAKMKAEGQKKGVLDYFLPVPRHGFHGLYLELKAMGGRPEPEQLDFARGVTEQGYKAVFCKGWVEAWAEICAYLGIQSKVI